METKLGRKIQVALCQAGARVWRNNVGMGWIGEPVHCGKDVILKNARPLHSGLCEGSSDFIGFIPITVTQHMVGKRMAVFLAAEIKTGRGIETDLQENFRNMVNANGGIAFVARSVEEAEEKLNAASLRLS
jgi:hypothetical protein